MSNQWQFFIVRTECGGLIDQSSIAGSEPVPEFLMHRAGDDVGVAIRDIAMDERVEGLVLETGDHLVLTSRAAVPFGHKIAASAISDGGTVTEYSVPIGLATDDIEAGDHVHVHNLQSIRWREPVLAAAGDAS